MGSANGTSIQTNRLECTWKVEMKGKDNIKWEGVSQKGDRREDERNTVAIKNQTCNVT